MKVTLGCFVLACALSTAVPRTAAACQPPSCWPSGALVPYDGVTVPASLTTLVWRPADLARGGAHDLSKLWLAEVDGSQLAFTPTQLASGAYVLTLVTPLTAGKRYRFVDGNVCKDPWAPNVDAGVPPDQGSAPPSGGSVDVTFNAGAAAPLPTSLGTLTSKNLGSAVIGVATASGSCETEIRADRVAIELVVAAGAQPWFDVLHFETYVDGQRWYATESINTDLRPGTSWRGRGADLLYAACEVTGSGEPIAGLQPGNHSVELRATLPGTSVALATPPIEVSLSCPPRTDAGVGRDAGPADDFGHPPTTSRTSGCALGGRPARVAGSLLPVVLALLLLGRRRWRARR